MFYVLRSCPSLLLYWPNGKLAAPFTLVYGNCLCSNKSNTQHQPIIGYRQTSKSLPVVNLKTILNIITN